jgi:hypothetical protein
MKNVTLLAVLLLSAIGAWAVQDSEPMDSAPPYSVSISAPGNTHKIGIKLTVDVTLTDLSQHNIAVPRQALGEMDYLVELYDDKGDPVPETRYYEVFKCQRQEGPCPDGVPSVGPTDDHGTRTLEPGGTLKESIDLGKLFKLEQPGTYVVQVRRADFLYAGGRPRSEVIKSNPLTLTVSP